MKITLLDQDDVAWETFMAMKVEKFAALVLGTVALIIVIVVFVLIFLGKV